MIELEKSFWRIAKFWWSFFWRSSLVGLFLVPFELFLTSKYIQKFIYPAIVREGQELLDQMNRALDAVDTAAVLEIQTTQIDSSWWFELGPAPVATSILYTLAVIVNVPVAIYIFRWALSSQYSDFHIAFISNEPLRYSEDRKEPHIGDSI